MDLLQKDSNTNNTLPRTGAADASAVTQEEWEAKYATVTGLLPAYKSCKDEEQAARAELETLLFTLATVREQRKAVEDRIGAQERKVGAEGFAQASVLLDKVSSIFGCLLQNSLDLSAQGRGQAARPVDFQER